MAHGPSLVIDSTHLTLQGSTFANDYVSGGVLTYGFDCDTALFESQTIGATPPVAANT